MKSGILKKLTGPLIMITTILSLGGGLFSFQNSMYQTQIYEKYAETDIFAEQYDQDLEALNNAYQNGEMSESEFAKAKKELRSDKYIKEVLERDIEGNEDYQAIIKRYEAFSIAGICSMLAGMLILATLMTANSISGKRKNNYQNNNFPRVKKSHPLMGSYKPSSNTFSIDDEVDDFRINNYDDEDGEELLEKYFDYKKNNENLDNDEKIKTMNDLPESEDEVESLDDNY